MDFSGKLQISSFSTVQKQANFWKLLLSTFSVKFRNFMDTISFPIISESPILKTLGVNVITTQRTDSGKAPELPKPPSRRQCSLWAWCCSSCAVCSLQHLYSNQGKFLRNLWRKESRGSKSQTILQYVHWFLLCCRCNNKIDWFWIRFMRISNCWG